MKYIVRFSGCKQLHLVGMTEYCCADKLVLIRTRVHPFPSRTRKLSSLLPTILGWRRPGKIGSANTKAHDIRRGLLLCLHKWRGGYLSCQSGMQPTISRLPAFFLRLCCCSFPHLLPVFLRCICALRFERYA